MKKPIYLLILTLGLSALVSCHGGSTGSTPGADSAAMDSMVEQAQQTVAADTAASPSADTLKTATDSMKLK